MTVQIITTVLVPATAPQAPASLYDLTDLATVHSELKIATSDTANDAWLSQAITQASTAIRLYVKQPLQIETLQDLAYLQQDPYPFQTPAGVGVLQLSRFPVVNFTTALTGGALSGSVLPFASTAGAVVGQPISGTNILPATTIAAVTPNVSVTLSQAIAGEILAGAPITFGLSVWQIVAAAGSPGAVPVLQNFVLNQDYAADPANGQLLRLDPFTGVPTVWEAVPLLVQYSAGYATVPPDVVEATLRMLTGRWWSRGVNPYLKSLEQPGSGVQTWWVGGPPKSGNLPEEITGMLDPYRVRSVY